MLDKYEDVLTVDEMCRALRIGKNAAYALLKNGTIQCKRIRSKYIIPKKRVIEYLKS